jgi:hypothetical protein
LLNGAYLHLDSSFSSSRSGKQFRNATAEPASLPTCPHLAKMPGRARPIVSRRAWTTSHSRISRASYEFEPQRASIARLVPSRARARGAWGAWRMEGQYDAALLPATPHLQIKATGAALPSWSSLRSPLALALLLLNCCSCCFVLLDTNIPFTQTHNVRRHRWKGMSRPALWSCTSVVL